MKLNNKGIGFLDTLTSLVIVMAIVIILVNFSKFTETSLIENRIKMTLYENVNNVISLGCFSEGFTYDEAGSLSTKTIDTEYGDIFVTCKFYKEDLSDYENNKTIITFEFEDIVENYALDNIKLK